MEINVTSTIVEQPVNILTKPVEITQTIITNMGPRGFDAPIENMVAFSYLMSL